MLVVALLLLIGLLSIAVQVAFVLAIIFIVWKTILYLYYGSSDA